MKSTVVDESLPTTTTKLLFQRRTYLLLNAYFGLLGSTICILGLKLRGNLLICVLYHLFKGTGIKHVQYCSKKLPCGTQNGRIIFLSISDLCTL